MVTSSRAFTEMGSDSTPRKPTVVKNSVRMPENPAIARSVNAATPSTVGTVVVPVSVPPPLAMNTETAVPVSSTGLPDASWSRTTGCWAKGIPFSAIADGCVRSASCDGGPAINSIGGAMTDSTPGETNVSV